MDLPSAPATFWESPQSSAQGYLLGHCINDRIQCLKCSSAGDQLNQLVCPSLEYCAVVRKAKEADAELGKGLRDLLG